MEKSLFDLTSAKVDEMLAAPSASEATKAAAQAWKDAIAAGADADVTTATLLDAVSEKQTTIDALIGFVGSEMGAQVFGDAAPGMLAHEEERKAAGAAWCDCAACRPCHELLCAHGREEADVYL